ncbi:MAG: hypothetical protein ACXIUV_07100 [Alkalilacustris sp.]
MSKLIKDAQALIERLEARIEMLHKSGAPEWVQRDARFGIETKIEDLKHAIQSFPHRNSVIEEWLDMEDEAEKEHFRPYGQGGGGSCVGGNAGAFRIRMTDICPEVKERLIADFLDQRGKTHQEITTFLGGIQFDVDNLRPTVTRASCGRTSTEYTYELPDGKVLRWSHLQGQGGAYGQDIPDGLPIQAYPIFAQFKTWVAAQAEARKGGAS